MNTDRESAGATRPTNRRILLIDDNRAIHADFRKILTPDSAAEDALAASESALFGSAPARAPAVSFETESAYQGLEGVALAQKALAAGCPFALAFVDVRMPPGIDGIETTRLLWAADPDLQIVICTAYSDYSWGEIFGGIGRPDQIVILKKPFDAIEALQLAWALTEKWNLAQASRLAVQELERAVASCTEALEQPCTGGPAAEVRAQALRATVQRMREAIGQLRDHLGGNREPPCT